MSGQSNHRLAFIGASRGLGAALCRHLFDLNLKLDLLMISRKQDVLEELAQRAPDQANVKMAVLDVSKPTDQDGVLEELQAFSPTRVIYFVAGGPFGAYGSKAWKDHRWAFEVSLLFPSRLLHFCLHNPWPQLKQLILLGSAVAEDRADPFAASYAAAKHGLLGLHRSLREEHPALDVRLFSPGYMDTELLPKNAYPRQQGAEILDPAIVAKKLWDWAQSDENMGHCRYT